MNHNEIRSILTVQFRSNQKQTIYQILIRQCPRQIAGSDSTMYGLRDRRRISNQLKYFCQLCVVELSTGKVSHCSSWSTAIELYQLASLSIDTKLSVI